MNYFKIIRDLYRLKKQADLNIEEMHLLQERKLKVLLHYAWEHSAYYRRTFEHAGIRENQLDTLPLSCFPTLDKGLLLGHFNELVTEPEVTQEELRRFDAEVSADRNLIKTTTISCILPAAPELRGTLFMTRRHGAICFLVLSGALCGICPCRRF